MLARFCALNQRDDARDTTIDLFLTQCAGSDGLLNLLVVIGTHKRHLQIQSGRDTGNAVVHRTPVGHHKPVESKLGAQHVGEQPLVVARIDALDTVVGAHDGPGLHLFEYSLKGGKI